MLFETYLLIFANEFAIINKMFVSEGINNGKLQSIIIEELKKAGVKHRLKKIILKNVKDHKAVFGAPLAKVPSTSVICCGGNLSVPTVVSEMSSVLRSNAHVEGLFRKAGSQSRQKDIERLLDAGGCVSDGHHPIDVASILKLYLRCLPEPLISAEVQDLLLRCRITAGDTLKLLLQTLLLLPVLHVHLLHYIMELLNFIASKHKDNLMDTSNLAIVMAPSIMPLHAASSGEQLEDHIALVKMFIENSKHIGLLTEDLMSQLDDYSDVGESAAKSRAKKRRSRSVNRMLSGLRKMVSGNVDSPATACENGTTPLLSKSAAKRKFDSYDGLSAKTKGLERKRLRLSLMASSTPVVNSDLRDKNSESSMGSEDLLTSSERLFSAHDTIDLSPVQKQSNKVYVRISKVEYEEIKSRLSALESRLSREVTDVIPRVQPLQQVQNLYEQTLEDVAMFNCPNSDHLARRLGKELKICPEEQGKIIRSPSVRKIGTIGRISKENVTKIVRHNSWSVSSLSQATQHGDRFYPYMGLSRRERTTSEPQLVKMKVYNSDWDSSKTDTCMNNIPHSSVKYQVSLAPDYNLDKTVDNTKLQTRKSLNITINNNSWTGTVSENSMNNTLSSSGKSEGRIYQNCRSITKSPSRSQAQSKWRSAASFLMEETEELDNNSQSGRPSVNKLRRQNAGAVLATAKLFETSSDRSSEQNDKPIHTGFARRPRINAPIRAKSMKNVALVRPPLGAGVKGPAENQQK